MAGKKEDDKPAGKPSTYVLLRSLDKGESWRVFDVDVTDADVKQHTDRADDGDVFATCPTRSWRPAVVRREVVEKRSLVPIAPETEQDLETLAAGAEMGDEESFDSLATGPIPLSDEPVGAPA